MRVPRQPAYHAPDRAAEPESACRVPPAGWRRRWWRRSWRRVRLRWVAAALALVVLGSATAGWCYLRGLDGNIVTDVTTADELERHRAERPARTPGEAKNILVIGVGDRSPDTVLLFHLAGDRRSATAVALPRALAVDVPRCTGVDGTGLAARRATLDAAYASGGAACLIRTLEGVSGIRVDHHLIVDYAVLGQLADAVGGVEPCTLDALARKIASSGVLLNPAKLLPLLDDLTSSITSDTELNSLRELYDLMREVRAVPRDELRFLTVPTERRDPSVLAEAEADALFARLREDRPVSKEDGGPPLVTSGDAAANTMCE
ncbi:LCP family protein [Streptomyces sp. NPDC127098]|uniref:LCP family protein n=1 Tax=Streptomyces sp. NPDC127098 TaxID=3347137 RepID=UPI003646370E